MAENHDARSRRQVVIFEEPPSGGFSRAIWLEYANEVKYKGGDSSGTNITALSENDFGPYRRRMQLIFQDPYASLNPRMTVRDIVADR